MRQTTPTGTSVTVVDESHAVGQTNIGSNGTVIPRTHRAVRPWDPGVGSLRGAERSGHPIP
jgi:hypothetical protein